MMSLDHWTLRNRTKRQYYELFVRENWLQRIWNGDLIKLYHGTINKIYWKIFEKIKRTNYKSIQINWSTKLRDGDVIVRGNQLAGRAFCGYIRRNNCKRCHRISLDIVLRLLVPLLQTKWIYQWMLNMFGKRFGEDFGSHRKTDPMEWSRSGKEYWDKFQ